MMLNTMQTAIIFKDIQGITANKRMLSVLFIVPLVMTVMMPSIFIMTIQFGPEDEVVQLAGMMGYAPAGSANLQQTAIALIINYVMPIFFLLIPIMASSVMAANSFVGEKEKRTLETLLYSPLPLKDIFSAKILASFLLSMAVSFFSFIVMFLAIEIEVFLTGGALVMPGINWLIVMLLASPSASLLTVNLIVRGSAKSQSSEESQQRAGFLVLPIMLLAVGQFSGIMLLSAWLFLAIGAALAAIALLLLKGSFGKFQYETLLL